MTASGDIRIFTGRFWRADLPTHVVPGSLDLRGGRPQLHLLGALSAVLVETGSPSPGVTAFGPAPKPGPQTIYGVVLGSPGRVTLINSYQVKLTAASLLAWSGDLNGGLQEERFEADYAVLGMHVPDMDAAFAQYRFQVRHQDDWAGLSGLQMTMSMAENRFTGSAYEYTDPEAIAAALAENAGTLQLQATATISPPSLWGARIRTSTWLVVKLADPITIRSAWQRYPLATGTLLTMLFGKECTPTTFEVQDPSTSRWCPITTASYQQEVELGPPTRLAEAPLFGRDQLSLEHLAAWFDVNSRLSPLPQTLAGAVTDSSRTLPNLLLELITTAEGLHRRLHPDSRRLTKDQVEEALAALTQSEMGKEASKLSPARFKLIYGMQVFRNG